MRVRLNNEGEVRKNGGDIFLRKIMVMIHREIMREENNNDNNEEFNDEGRKDELIV